MKPPRNTPEAEGGQQMTVQGLIAHGKELGEAQRYQEALKAYLAALHLDANHPEAWNGVGCCQHKLGQHAAAFQAFGRAMELDPRYVKPWMNMATIQLNLMCDEEAEATLRTALKQIDSFAPTWRMLATAVWNQERVEEALKIIYKARELDPSGPATFRECFWFEQRVDPRMAEWIREKKPGPVPSKWKSLPLPFERKPIRFAAATMAEATQPMDRSSSPGEQMADGEKTGMSVGLEDYAGATSLPDDELRKWGRRKLVTLKNISEADRDWIQALNQENPKRLRWYFEDWRKSDSRYDKSGNLKDAPPSKPAAPDQEQPSSQPWVISWFGYEVVDNEALENDQVIQWDVRLKHLTESFGFRIERPGNMIDLIIGKQVGSVSHREFFAFQNKWDQMNERLGIRMSGMLILMHRDGPGYDSSACELYRKGKRSLGDSIGRPQRHYLGAVKSNLESARIKKILRLSDL